LTWAGWCDNVIAEQEICNLLVVRGGWASSPQPPFLFCGRKKYAVGKNNLR